MVVDMGPGFYRKFGTLPKDTSAIGIIKWELPR